MGDNLGNHRIVKDRHLTACHDPGVNPHIWPCGWQGKFLKGACLRQKPPPRILGIKTHFNGMASGSDGILAEINMRPLGNTDLPVHKIKTGDHFGNRVFDLQAGIHFHEIKPAVSINNELHRACPNIVHGLCRSDSRRRHFLAGLGVKIWRRCFFNNFLMTPLQRTITL